MAVEEIVNGIKNAMERGYSLEQAKQSFINAGFSRDEVEAASSSLGISNYVPPVQKAPVQNQMQSQTQAPKPSIITPQHQLPSNVPQPRAMLQNPNQLPYQQKESSSRTGLIIALVVILVILLGVLAASFFFKQQILDYIAGK